MSYETWTALPADERQVFLSDNLQALVSGQKWSSPTMTYGFLSNGDGREDFNAGPSLGAYQFEPFSALQQDFVRFVLSYVEALVPIDFVEVQGAAAYLGFGKYDMPYDGGYASYPNPGGEAAVFVDSKPETNPTNGNPAELGSKVFSTIVHEIGHALGLSHPVPYNDFETHPDPMPDAMDSGVLSVMSYRSWYHGEFDQGGRVWALGPLDIAALIHIYGPRANNAADTYRITEVTNAAPSVQGNDWQLSVAFPFVLADTGGFDTIDIANLAPGTLATPNVFSFQTGLAATLGTTGWIAGPSRFEELQLPEWNPRLQIQPGTQIEKFVGGDGHDVVLFQGIRADYAVTMSEDGSVSITGDGATKFVAATERLMFSDTSYNLDIASLAATVAPAVVDSVVDLYVAYFNRVPEAGGLGYWIDQYLAGKSLATMAAEFYAAGIQFSNVTGYTADMPLSDFVKVLYANVLGRSGSSAPPQADIDYWLDQVGTGAVTREGMVARFLNDARMFYDDPNVDWVPRLLDQKLEFGKLHAVTYGLDYNDSQTSIQTTVALAAAVTPTGYADAVAMVGLSADDYLAV